MRFALVTVGFAFLCFYRLTFDQWTDGEPCCRDPFAAPWQPRCL